MLQFQYSSSFPSLKSSKQKFPDSPIDGQKLSILFSLPVAFEIALNDSCTMIEKLTKNLIRFAATALDVSIGPVHYEFKNIKFK